MVAHSKTNYLFVGNPGVGKSTIMNGFIGYPHFKSGFSKSGKGITFQFDSAYIEVLKTWFYDTPGLSDVKLKKQAAEAITEALKQDGFYKIFFVITEEAGRIRPADSATIQLILEAAPPIVEYNIIVNKVSKRLVRDFTRDPEAKSDWVTMLLANLPRKTINIHFIGESEELKDEDNVDYKLDQATTNFINAAPGMIIPKEDVNDVKADELTKLEEKHEEEMNRLKADNDAFKREAEAQAIQLRQQVADADQRMQAALARASEDLENVRAEAADAAQRATMEANAKVAEIQRDAQMRQADLQQRMAAMSQPRPENKGPDAGRIVAGILSFGISELFR